MDLSDYGCQLSRDDGIDFIYFPTREIIESSRYWLSIEEMTILARHHHENE